MTLETGVKELAEAVGADVAELTTRLNDIDSLIGDVEAVLIAINGEP